jgi:1-acyl-sn-glycerol-3-phosphate acyltransferase
MGAIYRTHYEIAKFLARTLFGFQVEHGERIPTEGSLILAMNHESYLDPPLAGISCDREIFYLARKTLLEWPILGPIFPHLNVIPVDQERADMSALKSLIKVVRAGNASVIFPEGSRTLDGKLQEAQPGLGLVIAKTLAPVVPMRVFGAYQAFPRGGRPRLFSPIRLVVGEPMHFTAEDLKGREGRELYQHLSDRVMRVIEGITPDS